MTAQLPDYSEPIKNEIRRAVLTHAVRSLTVERDESALVSEEHFLRMLTFVLDEIRLHCQQDLRPAMAPVIDHWLKFRSCRVAKREPHELQVLILCGPNPTNDIAELVRLGVSPFNIWAVESDAAAFTSAIEILQSIDLPLKIHKGSLKEFFEVVPQQFDIVYFDACGPLMGGKPPTLPVLKELIINQRLNEVSCLITNFADISINSNQLDAWTNRLATWFAPRVYWEQPIDPGGESDENFQLYQLGKDNGKYVHHVRSHLDSYYSEFVTDFIRHYACTLLPWWRISALPAAAREYFSSIEERASAVQKSLKQPVFDENFEAFEMPALVPSMYPFLQTAHLAKRLPPGDPLRAMFWEEKFRGIELVRAVDTASIVRFIYDWGMINNGACSEAFMETLVKFRWFDSPGNSWYRLFCDTPLPNLIIDLCFGQLGYPYHTNCKKHKRFKYQARATPMYTDVFVLDQLRYMYDLVPNIAMLKGEGLPDSTQFFIRICLDAIRRHANSGQDPFWACALTGSGDFPIFEWTNRVDLGTTPP